MRPEANDRHACLPTPLRTQHHPPCNTYNRYPLGNSVSGSISGEATTARSRGCQPTDQLRHKISCIINAVSREAAAAAMRIQLLWVFNRLRLRKIGFPFENFGFRSTMN